MTFVLHGFFRSSTSFRVRAALNLKGIAFDQATYALRKGEQRSPAYLALNPQGLVPSLETPDGILTQSLAIIEWLDEVYPDPALLPRDPWGRARVRSLAQIVALDVHPINNLRVLQYLGRTFGADEAQQAEWVRHWVDAAFHALEARLSQEPETGRFCHGDTPGLADLCLAAQVINNARFAVDMSPYLTIQRIHDNCMAIPAFENASPAHQPDAV
jgi:maleylpyruvate isomerase